MNYQVTHTTRYSYAEPAPICHNLVHLSPRTTRRQRPSGYRLRVNPTPAFVVGREDYFGNWAECFSIEGPHRELEITTASNVEVLPLEARSYEKSPAWESCVVARRSGGVTSNAGVGREWIDPVLTQLTYPSPRVPSLPDLRKYAESSFKPGRPVVEALRDLTRRIHIDFQFDQRATNVDTPIVEVLRLRRGVCQDFAHLITGCARSMGLAARYVSGYLQTAPPPGRPRLVGADASHAWTAVWCGQTDWLEFDPTNNCIVSDAHITVAWGRDYSDVCPIQGVFVGGGEQRMWVSVDVAPIDVEVV